MFKVNWFKPRKQSLKSKFFTVTRKKKPNFIKAQIDEAKEILIATGKEYHFTTVCLISTPLFVLGIIIATALSNPLMLPILGIGLSLLQFWYVKFTARFYKKNLIAEFETTLFIIPCAQVDISNLFVVIFPCVPKRICI